VRFARLLDNHSKIVKTQTFLSDEQQRANHPANLPREKSVRSKITKDTRILATTFSLKHRAHARMRSRLQRVTLIGTTPESAEVLAPRQYLAGALHQINIQRLRAKVTISGQ
jgi:hypothetical protein